MSIIQQCQTAHNVLMAQAVLSVNLVFILILECVFFINNLVNKSCVSCTIPNCLTCTDGPKCTSCDTNYAINFVSCIHIFY